MKEIEEQPIIYTYYMINRTSFGPIRLEPTMINLCGKCFNYYQPVIETSQKAQLCKDIIHAAGDIQCDTQCGYNVGTKISLCPVTSNLKETFPKKSGIFPDSSKTGPKCTCGSAAVKSPTHSDWCDVNTQLAPKSGFGSEIDWDSTFTDFMMSDPDKTQPLKKP